MNHYYKGLLYSYFCLWFYPTNIGFIKLKGGTTPFKSSRLSLSKTHVLIQAKRDWLGTVSSKGRHYYWMPSKCLFHVLINVIVTSRAAINEMAYNNNNNVQTLGNVFYW